MQFSDVITLLQKDINYRASKVVLAGFSFEDIKQDLIFQLWRKIHLYSPWQGYSLRTWAAYVMDRRIKDLISASRLSKRAIYLEYVVNYDPEVSDNRILEKNGHNSEFETRCLEEQV